MNSNTKERTTMGESLPLDFVPSPFDLIIGRGKKCANHPGNKRMKSMVQAKLEEYRNAHDKTHKTYIISQIFQDLCKLGCRFVKKDNQNGLWFRLKDPGARANIAQCFRDSLHESYHSSKVNKKHRRWCNIHQQQQSQQRKQSQKTLPPLPACAGPASAASEASSFGLQFMVKTHSRYSLAFSSTPPADCTVSAAPAKAALFNEVEAAPLKMKSILSEALDVVSEDKDFFESFDLVEPTPSFPLPVFNNKRPHMTTIAAESGLLPTSFESENVDIFDSLLSMTFFPTDDDELDNVPVGNPFEPTPIAEVISSSA